MSSYMDTLLIFIFCIFLYPVNQWDALHITCALLLFAFFCFMTVTKQQKILTFLGILTLLITVAVPDTTVFLPLVCYIYFYRKQYVFSAFYNIPVILYIFEHTYESNIFLIAAFILSFYLAYQSSKISSMQKDIYRFRDNSIENEMILKEKNRHLLENQNDRIYIATLKERNRIAREIHDNVGHLLSRSILQVGALLAISKDESITSYLSTLKETLDTSMNSIRNSVHDLHDESIDLEHALLNLTENFTFCSVTLNCEVSKHIPKDVKYCFLAIVKEALNNTMKHSDATKITITVKEHPAFYQLLLEDNGTKKSSQTNVTNSAGIGLSNMKDRVNALHGIIHIDNNQGFRIFVSIPK